MSQQVLVSIEQLTQQVTQNIANIIPAVAKGTVQSQVQGWNKAFYYDFVTGQQITFSKPPTVVAVALVRTGLSKIVTAPAIVIPTVALPSVPNIAIPTVAAPAVPTISIPSMALPAAPTIDIPSITLPTLPTVTIPDITSDVNALLQALGNLQGYEFTCGSAFSWLCDQLNKLMALWSTAVQDLMTGVVDFWQSFEQAKKNLQDLITGVSALRDNTQAALNAYQANIQSAVNSALSDVQSKVQAALNAYQNSIQSALNGALGDYSTKVQNALNNDNASIQSAVNSALNDFQNKAQAALNAQALNMQDAVNAGLRATIPTLYDMLGLPTGTVSGASEEMLRSEGDINGDGVIDQQDMALLQAAWGSTPGSANWNPAANLSGNNHIGTVDLAILSANYGKTVDVTVQLLSPVQVQNVAVDGFEWYGLSIGMQIAYIAIGSR